MWNKHVQKKTAEKQAKNFKYCRFHPERKCENNHPMVLWIIFKGKIKILPEQSVGQDDHFESHSGLKNLLKIAILKMG